MAANTPVFLSIAGSDCSAGAGAQADLKTGFALGCYPLTAITCVVSEVPGNVSAISPLEPDFVRDQIELCLKTFPVRAVKLGMLYSPAIVEAVAAALDACAFSGPIVTDPVMIASAGEPLMLQEAIQAYETHIFPRTLLLTPNRDELAVLSMCPDLRTPEHLRNAAQELADKLDIAVLAKGGHLQSEETCTDILTCPGRPAQHWEHPRTQGITTHGTGCTLSSAVTAFLARGEELAPAVEHALSYVAVAIENSHRWPDLDALNHALH